MKNKQVLAYGLLVSRNDLRSIFVGHIHFMKLMSFFYNVNTQEPFLKTKIWDRVCLRHI